MEAMYVYSQHKVFPFLHPAGSRWQWVTALCPSHLTVRKEPQYLGRPQSQSGHLVEEKTFLALLGYKPWIIQSIAYLLYCLNKFTCKLAKEMSGNLQLIIFFFVNN
jgi:hypothetical protein